MTATFFCVAIEHCWRFRDPLTFLKLDIISKMTVLLSDTESCVGAKIPSRFDIRQRCSFRQSAQVLLSRHIEFEKRDPPGVTYSEYGNYGSCVSSERRRVDLGHCAANSGLVCVVFFAGDIVQCEIKIAAKRYYYTWCMIPSRLANLFLNPQNQGNNTSHPEAKHSFAVRCVRPWSTCLLSSPSSPQPIQRKESR